MEEELEMLLREMGVHRLYKGRYPMIRAVEIVREDENRLFNVVNEIYKAIGTERGVKWTAIERQMRTVVSVAWKTNSQSLAKIAGYPLIEPPTVSEFIEILYNYTERHLTRK